MLYHTVGLKKLANSTAPHDYNILPDITLLALALALLLSFEEVWVLLRILFSLVGQFVVSLPTLLQCLRQVILHILFICWPRSLFASSRSPKVI